MRVFRKTQVVRRAAPCAAWLWIVGMAWCGVPGSARGEFVLPTIGGDQVTMMQGAQMVHLGVAFDGTDISVHADATATLPLLRPLTPPAEFAPVEKWNVLRGKAYNFQYGWLAEGAWTPPTDTAVWVEVLSSSPELETYEGGRFMSETTVRAMTFAPLFGTAGSSSRWKWPGMMMHNAYAVRQPTAATYEATYRVYLGHLATGDEVLGPDGAPQFGSDTVTIRLAATPVPEPAALALAAGGALALTRRRTRRAALLACVGALAAPPAGGAQFVTPQMGGGQVGMAAAPMKHADVLFDGARLEVHIDTSIDDPVLRPLEPGFAFDDQLAWGVLERKAYNFQFGWNPGGFLDLPAGTWIWIEQLSATPGLEVYQRPPASPAYQPIFGADGSATRWRWSGSMTHNAYAVAGPLRSTYEAAYRVYLGDDVTGEPAPGYEPALTTFRFTAAVDPLGDFNDDRRVDGRDLLTWQVLFAQPVLAGAFADANGDETIDERDLAGWRREFAFVAEPDLPAALSVPEPTHWASLLPWATLCATRRGRC